MERTQFFVRNCVRLFYNLVTFGKIQMNMEEVIVNKVAESGIISLDLKKFYPKEEIVPLDLKSFLFMEMILKEKDFRKQLTETDWGVYKGKIVAVHCSVDALIPNWAYMLLSTYLVPAGAQIAVGSKMEVATQILLTNISQSIQIEEFTDKRVVIKGCGDTEIPAAAFAEITRILQPVVKSLMYGEPCSTVPVYKKKA